MSVRANSSLRAGAMCAHDAALSGRLGIILGMKAATKSSISLPPAEFQAVQGLRTRVAAASNVEVIRRALAAYEAAIDREAARVAFRDASLRVREVNRDDLAELDAVPDGSA
jgi:hypothetical protein